MTQSKHTKGPWEFRKDDCWTIFADGSSIMGDMQYYPWVPDNEADWRLIAAAPELLEALQECNQIDDLHRQMHRIEKRRNRGSFGIAVSDDEDAIEWQKLSSEVEILISKRNAAIAKATGA